MTERELRDVFAPIRNQLDEIEELFVIAHGCQRFWMDRCAELVGRAQLDELFADHGVLDDDAPTA